MIQRRQLANAVRALAMDAVQRANSGHPGMPMGMADIAQVLWSDFMVCNPNNPDWFNRDRFVLSNGHGSMLLYAVLHLTGYDLTLDDLKNFRQLHSKTPGHPELADTPGVETTTGPLGQGLANAVGLALAEKMMAAQFNQPEHVIVDHYTYAFAGDGCLMEGVSHEACSLAGTLGLDKLIVMYDDNGISIDGEVAPWFADNTPMRFESYGWHVIADVDGHDAQQIREAIIQAQQATDKPTLICCKTHIGFGSPNKVDTSGAHGAPLGDDEIALARKELEWSHAPFEIPVDIQAGWDLRTRGQEFEDQWNARFAHYESSYPELAAQFMRRTQGWMPEDWSATCDALIQEACAHSKPIATRKSSLACLNAIAKHLPELVGGSADLTGSNCTKWEGAKTIIPGDLSGDYIQYGVREFAMSAIMNGLALHGGLIPFGGTFLVFSDYARNAVRLSALMQQKVIYVYSHDSIGLGEDGPTHQPIEHLAMLRATPGLNVWRPCDQVETAVAWCHALQHQGPSCLLLSRQNLQQHAHVLADKNKIEQGGYVLIKEEKQCDAIILATGSEVDIAVKAAALLKQQSIDVRVVSMPCCDIFKMQDAQYRQQVLPRRLRLE